MYLILLYLLVLNTLCECLALSSIFFFSNDSAPTDIYTLSLHDALPISVSRFTSALTSAPSSVPSTNSASISALISRDISGRSEEHTSELQSLRHLVCRLLLEKKKKHQRYIEMMKIDIERTTDKDHSYIH